MDRQEMLYLSILADAMLCAALILLWLGQREERHAVYWGLGQLALGFMTVLWVFQPYPPGTWLFHLHRLEILTCFSVGLLLYIQGTQVFLGAPLAWRRLGYGFLSLILLFTLLGNIDRTLSEPLAVLFIGGVLAWAGYRLALRRPVYRLVGAIFLLRGVLNVAFALNLTNHHWLPTLYLLAFFTKTLSMLGLLYVVQHEVRERFPNAMRFLSDGIWVHDRAGKILYANPACVRLFGGDQNDNLQGGYIHDFVHSVTNELLESYYHLLSLPDESFPLCIESVGVGRQGSLFPLEGLISPYWEHGNLLFLVQLRDISARKRQEQLLLSAANVDDVTELASRYALNERLATLTAEGAPCHPHALIFLDLDDFKRINDTLGHPLGDALLHGAGDRLSQLMDDVSCVARFGGDEFVVLLPGASEEGVRELGLQLASAITNSFREPFVLGNMNVVVTTSIGIAFYPEQASDGDMLLRYADSAMYAAKRGGRNQYRVFDDALAKAAHDSLTLDIELRQAMKNKEFSLVYQPIIDVRSGNWCKVEALVRWNSPRLGMVSPDRFIPVAEESGLILPLGRWILQEACRQLGAWQRGENITLANVSMSVNVAAWQLADTHFIQDVEQALQAAGIAASSLELELTERTLIEEDPVISASLQALRSMGVKLALDDFGTGYSSLNYLSRFMLDTLKIDRSFIIDLESNQRCRDLTRHIIGMGKTLGLVLVAEGVETQAQAELLGQFGCEQLQGYLFSRPLPAIELAQQGVVCE